MLSTHLQILNSLQQLQNQRDANENNTDLRLNHCTWKLICNSLEAYGGIVDEQDVIGSRPEKIIARKAITLFGVSVLFNDEIPYKWVVISDMQGNILKVIEL